jgi:hypothetical protein
MMRTPKLGAKCRACEREHLDANASYRRQLGVEPFPSGENGLEVDVIEKDVIEHDIWHRTVAGAFCAVKLFRGPLS